MTTFSKMLLDSAAASVLVQGTGPIPTHNRDLTTKPPENREVRTDKGVNYMARVKHGRTEWFIVEENPSITTEVAAPPASAAKTEDAEDVPPVPADKTDGTSDDAVKEPAAAKRKTAAKATA